MAEITDLNPVDASNIARFPENQNPSTVNNGARALEGLTARGLRDTVIPTKTSGGSANVQTLSPNQTVTAYAAGLSTFTFKAGFTNTAACTLNVATLGAVSIKMQNGSDPYAGAITAGGYYTVTHDGTNFILLNPSVKNLGADIVDDGSGNLTKNMVVVAPVDNFTFVAADRCKLYRSGAASKTWTLPAASSGLAGWNFEADDASGGTIIASPSTDLFVNGATAAASYTFVRGEWGTLKCLGGSGYVLNTNRPDASSTIRGSIKAATEATVTTGSATDAAVTPASLTTGVVLDRMASMSAGDKGTLAMVRQTSGTSTFGGTVSGSSLSPANAAGNASGTLSGTWRCLGITSGGVSDAATSLFVRIT